MARTPERWEVEDQDFWESTGKSIANRNLWISIPNLLCGFAVWLYWGMLAKVIQKVHFSNPDLFNFTFMNEGEPYDVKGYKTLMYTLPAVAGLAGATLRIPNSFMIAICGGRNVKFMTTVLMILPALFTGLALRDPSTPFYVYIILAAMSGVGGGAFASSMSNISFFFPKKMQGLALGLNAGLGNLGVSVMQFLIPWVITQSLFGELGGDPQALGVDSQLWVQNAAFVWVPVMTVLALLAAFFMNNLPQHECGATPVAIGKYLWLQLLGFLGAGIGVLLLVFVKMPIPELVRIFLVVLAAVVSTLLLMRFLTPQTIQAPLKKQFAIFGNRHTWVMTWLYTMTFGSFIGYAAAFPKLLDDIFVTPTNGLVTSNYIWIGVAVGALIRPVGGWLSDKLGGARVTQWDTWAMVGSTILAGYFVSLAGQEAAITDDAGAVIGHPEKYFIPFLLTFIVLFATTGIGNGSTFRMIPFIFPKDQAGPVLAWTSAIAAYGAFLIPKVFATQIKAGTPQYALYGFAVYYASCLVVNWWFYARKGAEIKC